MYVSIPTFHNILECYKGFLVFASYMLFTILSK